jgi:beta-lactamase regulating signal transducer with metallopeptidase domain
MILRWIAYAALCAALIGVAAACVDSVLAAFRRARRGLWISAMAASCIAPLALPFATHASTAPQRRTASVASALPNVDTNGQATTHTLDVILLAAWAATSFAFALTLLIAHRHTRSTLAACHDGVVGGRPTLISRDFGPAVVGVLRHHIVVPSWALELDDPEQRLVIAHELEHASSGDPLLAFAGTCAVVVMPWNVALWWQLARLRLAIELDCDARVVARRTEGALTYGRLLLSVGARGRATRHPALAMSRSRSALAKRFDALLVRSTVRPPRVVGLTLLSVGTVASIAFLPAPNVDAAMAAVRARETRPREVAVVQPVHQATFSFAPPTTDAARRPTPTISATRPKGTFSVTNIGVPPVRIVPPRARGPLDSVVVARATILPMTSRPMAGVLIASPSGAARAGFSAAVPGDSNRVIRANGVGGGRGGRAVLVPRPDTAPPR